MATSLSLSANQSAAASSSVSLEAHPSGRQAGILPVSAQMLAASNGAPSGLARQDTAPSRGAVPTSGGGDNAAEGPTQQDPSCNMANTKEKTPMCLLNELARFNKLQPKYELTNERGPPHEKIFTVCLTLGTQTYEASGPSIKKAQHAAAAQALEKCGLPHPIPRNNPPKFKRRNMSPNADAMTPTVKLNSLAMKTGKHVHYIPLNPLPPHPYYGGYRGPRNQHHRMPHPNQGMPRMAPGMLPPSQQNQGPHPHPEPGQSFHPPGPPAMAPPPMQQPQQQHGQGSANATQPRGLSAQGQGGMKEQGQVQTQPPQPTPQQAPQQPPQQPPPQQQQQGGAPPVQPPSPSGLPQQPQQPQQSQQQHHQVPPHHQHQQGGHPYANHHHRPYFPRYPRPFTHFVKVTVGDREFVGEGKTQKAARQNAAFKALGSLENEPSLVKIDQATTTNVPIDGNGDASSGDENNVKSDISLVYEAANIHDLNVVFKVLEESGQPHLKIFKIQCCVGDFLTEAEGSSKKAAKRRAAELMIPKLKALPAVPTKVPVRHRMHPQWAGQNKKKKPKSLQKTPPQDPNFGAPGLHPVSRLVQILQAKNEREPEFSVVEERPYNERSGHHVMRRREFTIQVTASSKTATGKGKTKKEAKKQAAENMLKELGYAPTPRETNGMLTSNAQPSKSALKTGVKITDESDRKVTFKEDKQKQASKKEEIKEASQPTVNNAGGKLGPGLLPMMPGMNQSSQMFPANSNQPGGHKLPAQSLNRAPGAPVIGTNLKVSPKSQAVTDIARDLLSLGHSPTAEALLKGTAGSHAIPGLSRPTKQLEYLAKVNSLSVKFVDYPKGNKAEFQSIVSVFTDPQSVFKAYGSTVEVARDNAAIIALRSFAGIADGSDGGKKGGQ
ncbi:double-stranded RNA-binding protein Staufen homolog 2-like [Diadema antillarum]|uniref:double-stranded RNA-binding protein Staufen homolog 2-like n=1 Tax=Diadema antillarum TaxID=105358 RepID=UPI003A8BF068